MTITRKTLYRINHTHSPKVIKNTCTKTYAVCALHSEKIETKCKYFNSLI